MSANSAGSSQNGSLAAFTALSALALIATRIRWSAKRSMSNAMFSSEHFSDEEILQQLVRSEFQTKLEEHNWELLTTIGPCFKTLAEMMMEGRSMEAAIRAQPLGGKLAELLISNQSALARAMREIAESYLARGLKTKKPQKSNKSSSGEHVVPDVLLKGSKGKFYQAEKFLAKGSAGSVYTAVRVSSNSKIGDVVDEASNRNKSKFVHAVSQQLQRQLALKRITPTQKSSAENEYRIASLLAEGDVRHRCVTYIDRADESPEHLWLVLRRIQKSEFGIDLREYITAGFFGMPENRFHGQSIVLQLLDGLEYISSCGVCMRDVKPDNVLIEQNIHLGGKKEYFARWSDFGLSVDVGKEMNAAGVRSPNQILGNSAFTESDLEERLVGFWYDTQKLVPKPKWVHRRPPEECYQNPLKVGTSSYDVYMVGIIFASMATGVDIPHIDKVEVKEALEKTLGFSFENDYLQSFELGQCLQENYAMARESFASAFGETFADMLLRETIQMLSLDPSQRPRPCDSFQRLFMVKSDQTVVAEAS